MPVDGEKSDLLKRFCDGGGKFLRDIAEDELKDILKDLAGHSLKVAVGTAAGSALIAGMPLWPVALALAAGSFGLLVMKGGKKESESADNDQLSKIEELIRSLPAQAPTASEFREQLRQLDIHTADVEKSVDALSALLFTRTTGILEQIQKQRAELTAYFNGLDARLGLFELKLDQIIHFLAKGPHFELFAVAARNRYLYSMERVELFGRDSEQKKLQDFLDDPKPVAWMVISGPGGMGKSRLAYWLCQEAKKKGWIAGKVDQTKDTENWDNWTPETPTLLFLDYVEGRINTIGPTLQRLCERAMPCKVRLLLVTRQMNSLWLDSFWGHENRKEYVEQCRFDELTLPPLDNDSLWQIFLAVADIHRKANERSEIDLASERISVKGKIYSRIQILNELNGIDNEKRPLFAAMAADAIIDGNMIRQWKQDELLEHILRHEKHLWKLHVGKKHSDIHKYENLIALSTLCRGLNLYDKDGQRLYSGIPPRVADQLPPADSWNLVWPMLGQEPNEETLPFLEPDLLGELFVLEQLKQIQSDAIKKDFFIAALRNSPEKTALMVAMTQRDYFNHNISQLIFGIVPSNTTDEAEVLAWAKYVFVFSIILPPDLYERHFQLIYEHVARKFSDQQEINQSLAFTLARLILAFEKAKEPEKAENVFQMLENIAGKFLFHEKINLALAISLFNFMVDTIRDRNAKKVEHFYNKLKNVVDKFPNNEEINFSMAKGVFNWVIDLTKTGDVKKAECIFKTLECIAARFPGHAEINLRLTKGAFHFINAWIRINKIDKAELVFQMQELTVDRFPNHEKINLELCA